ncbi:MAG: hypothetical protein KDC46_01485 [Thermoleophilia bacterium]|nr:hypothetical protein [Thermoleophilia bacterium]
MSNARRFNSNELFPATGHAPGELLWGEQPQRQPIAPLVLMAVVLLLVAAPSALASGGGTANPIRLLRDIADSTWQLTGLMKTSNETLAAIDENSSNLVAMQESMQQIATSTAGMESKTKQLNTKLAMVGTDVKASGATLQSVDSKLNQTAAGMTELKTAVSGSAASTKAIVGEFNKIDAAIGSMDRNLKTAITKMAESGPLTKAFAENRTRVAITGGDSSKYGVPNLAPDSRVMSVVLPMIRVMQNGGALPARKDRHEASNPIVGTALKLQVPDGVNVVAIVKPFDGYYGLPDENFFVQNRIYGF